MWGKIFIEPQSIALRKISKFDIYQVRSKLVYTRDAHNGDFCQVVQYFGYMNALNSGMRTSVACGSGLARARLDTDSSRLVGSWSSAIVFAGWLL